jgi:Bacterial Ig-like domain
VTRRKPPTRLAGIVFGALALLTAAAASGAPVNAYTVSSEPAIVKRSTPFTYTIRLTNNVDSPESAQRARIGIPAGFTVSSMSATTSAAGNCTASTWESTPIVNGIVEFKRPGGGSTELCPGGTLTVSIGASAPTDGIWTWTTELLRSTAFALQGSQPTLRVDGTPPVLSIDASPANPSKDSSPNFTFSADESGVSFECRLDAGAVGACVSPKSYGPLADGEHTFQLRGRDEAGNVGSMVTHTWTIDTVAPVVTLSLPIDGSAINDATPAFAGTAGTAPRDMPTVTVRVYVGSLATGTPLQAFAVDRVGGSWSGASGSLVEGVYTARAEQNDAAGNAGFSAPSTFTVDTGGPGVAITERPTNPSGSTTATFRFASTDPAASFRCRLDAGEFAPCASVITYQGLAPGGHVFAVNATDRAGNTGGNATYAWTIVVPVPPPLPAAVPAAPDVVPPQEVARVRVKATNATVTLTWVLPADPDFARVSVTRTVPGKGVRAITIYQGAKTSLTDRRLKNGVRYRYRITTHDRTGNASAGVEVAAVPHGPLLAPVNGARVTAPPLLRWQPTPRATYYNVQVWMIPTSGKSKAGRPVKVLSAWPSAPRLKLSRRWRFDGKTYKFAPGRYWWYVFPGFGKRAATNYGDLLGQSTFTVKAKRANKTARR